jgi:hypothetical protein
MKSVHFLDPATNLYFFILPHSYRGKAGLHTQTVIGNTVCRQTAFGRLRRWLRLLSAFVMGLGTPATPTATIYFSSEGGSAPFSMLRRLSGKG